MGKIESEALQQPCEDFEVSICMPLFATIQCSIKVKFDELAADVWFHILSKPLHSCHPLSKSLPLCIFKSSTLYSRRSDSVVSCQAHIKLIVTQSSTLQLSIADTYQVHCYPVFLFFSVVNSQAHIKLIVTLSSTLFSCQLSGTHQAHCCPVFVEKEIYAHKEVDT